MARRRQPAFLYGERERGRGYKLALAPLAPPSPARPHMASSLQSGARLAPHDRRGPAFWESIYDVDGFPYLTFYGVFSEMILRRVDEDLGEKRLLALGIWRKIDMSIPTVGATRALRNMVDAGRVGRQ